MARIIASCRPDLLTAFVQNELPPSEDESFYKCILRKKADEVNILFSALHIILIKYQYTLLSLQFDNCLQTASEEPAYSSSEEHDPHDLLYPHVPIMTLKIVHCPKPLCPWYSKNPRRQILARHIRAQHGDLSLIEIGRKLFPEHNKVAKRQCVKCGKLIAGRASQMKKHQRSSRCRK